MYIHWLFQREWSTPGRNIDLLGICERFCNRNFCFCLFTGKRFKTVLGGEMGVTHSPARGAPAVAEDVQKNYRKFLVKTAGIVTLWMKKRKRRQLWQGHKGESVQLNKRLLTIVFFLFVNVLKLCYYFKLLKIFASS